MAVAMRTNAEVKQNIEHELASDSRVESVQIHVHVSEGEVTLKGFVPMYSQIIAAEEISRRVPGVFAVRNELAVKWPEDTPVPPDEEIETHIRSSLLWAPEIDDGQITVAVADGIVELRGTVDAFWKKIRAESIALSVAGVVDIMNELAIVPTRKMDDQVLAETITESLERNNHVDASGVDVRVENGVATLSGSVTSLAGFNAIYDAVLYRPGIVDIVNNIAVRS